MADTISSVSSVTAEAAKSAPLLVVTGATFLGFTLQEWVYIATLTYTALQMFILIRDKLWRPWRLKDGK